MNPSLRPAKKLRAAPARGFTLVELITALVIIGIITAVLMGTAADARENAQRARARTELAMLAQSLESYRTQLGDYPRTNDPAALLQALIGRANAAGDAMSGRAWIELARFTTEPGRDPFADRAAVLLDPWGRPYRYAYSTSWNPRTFVLYSAGRDGADVAPDAATGNPQYDQPINADNLYAGRGD